ncbi:MAG TPA: nucleoside hydrolase [Bryobacteraceae bacterium]|nr:nucleoside hydrolase [Bryobacteraceae bacterium]
MGRILLIDTDTASDDAVALIMALRSREVRVAAITTVAGNVPVEQATRNALYTAELCGASTPIYMGCSEPLIRKYEDATWFHGQDGLGDQGYPAPKRHAEAAHAVEAILETVRANPGIELVTLGPLTNIAVALKRQPEMIRNVGRCVIMGGNPCCVGNVTPAAEYNMWVDPDAARIVCRSGLPIELVGWQLCRGEAVLNEGDIDKATGLGTALATFAIDCNSTAKDAYLRQTGEIGISLPDPVAMSVALDPSICIEASDHYLDVEVASDLTRGMTVVDQLNAAENRRNRTLWAETVRRAKPARICWTIDVARWKAALFQALRGL